MDKVEDIVNELNEEAAHLSRRSLDYGCADSGISSNLATKAADLIQSQQALIEEMREALRRGRYIFWGSTEANISEAEKWVDNVDGIMFRAKALSKKDQIDG